MSYAIRTICRLFVLLLCSTGLGQVCMAMPIDARADKICNEELAPLMKMPLAERRLSDAQVAKLIEMEEIDSISVRQCVCLALAFAQDANSLDLLRRLSKDTDESVQAAAHYALKVRDNNGRKPDEMLNNLCFWLGRSNNYLERIFLANRMWVDFGEDCIKTIMLAAKSEPEGIPDRTGRLDPKTMMSNIVRCDLLYYLSESSNKEILSEALKLKWDGTVGWSLSEADAYILGSVTPGRSKSYTHNSRPTLVRKIQAKLEKDK